MPQPGIRPHIERRQTSPFERLLTEISTIFINLPADRIDSEIGTAQQSICKLLDIDRSSLWIVPEDDPGSLELAQFHQPTVMSPTPEKLNARDALPWTTQKLMRGETVVLPRVTELPPEAGRDRETYQTYSTQSTVSVPLSVGGGEVFGVLAFATTGQVRNWSASIVQQFELVAQILAHALARKRTEAILAERLRFETLLTDISANFVNLPPDKVDRAIEDAQRRVCECLGLDLAALWQFSSDDPGSLIMTHIYRSREEPPLPLPMDAREYFPWSLRQVAAGRTIAVPSMAQLPDEAARDVEHYGYFGIQSTLVFPLCVGDRPPMGALGFNAIRAERTWPEAIVKRLRLVTELFTNALARQHAERELVKSEQRLRMIANALPAVIGYVDMAQRYRFNNLAYQEWFGVTPQEAAGRTIREVIGERAYAKAAPYLEEALAGRQVAFTQDLEWSDGSLRTMEATYVPERDARGDVCGLYILAIDVTERDRALQESRRLQDELLHAGRLATMGELAGTLAHEINQPLSAIMSNAQAAIRFLRLPAPDMHEIREILEDIVKEDARAGDIISRLRALLKKTVIAPESLDLNLILREVSGLLRSDAVVRDIKIALDLAPRLPLVSGDRIQLQQVALNLLLNAFEAMDDCPKADRRVSIRTRGQDGRVQASVEDSGSGIPAGATESIFDPYHTSKPQGLGLGLSICRTIIKRHQGRIWAENRPAGGAALHFSLPAQQEACCAT